MNKSTEWKKDMKKQPILPRIDYNSLFNSLPSPYIAFLANDPVFTIAAQNDGHEAISMTKREAILGKPLLEVFPDTSQKYLETGVSDLVESIRRVAATHQPDMMPTLRYDLKRPDGSFEERYWRVVHYPLFDVQGNLALIYQRTQDITREMTANERLERAEAQLDEALSIGKIGTWNWDLVHNRVIADKNLSAMFGVDAQLGATSLPTSAFINGIHKDDQPRIKQVLEKMLKGSGKPHFEQEYRTISRDGTVRWVMARGKLETDDSGTVTNFPGIIVDITERKNAEINLAFLAKASMILSRSLDYKKNLHTIADLVVPDIADWCGVDMLDDSGNIEQVVVVHKDLDKVAWAREYRVQRPVTKDDQTGVAKVIRTGKPEYYPIITDDLLVASAQSKAELKLARDLHLSSIIIVPLKVDGKTVGCLTLVSADSKRCYTQSDFTMAQDLADRASLAITKAHLYETAKYELSERKRLQEALRKSNEELELRVAERTGQLESSNTSLIRSNQELQDFAYVASHDLQEPLRKIQAFGNILEDEYGDVLGEGMDYLTRMRNAAARMSVLIQDLLAFSRVTTKARQFEPVDLNIIVKGVLSDLETRIEETGGKVQVVSLPTVMADALQMRQLLQNLISNALKFHKPNVPPLVKVDATIDYTKKGIAKHCRLAITDNGVGFDEKYLDRIFAVFQRLHGRDEFEGTGIGLAVCRKIVERHGGTITGQSKVGKGSTFVVMLPTDTKEERV